MPENVTKLPIKQEKSAVPSSVEFWRPFESLRGEIDRMFDDFGRGFGPHGEAQCEQQHLRPHHSSCQR